MNKLKINPFRLAAVLMAAAMLWTWSASQSCWAMLAPAIPQAESAVPFDRAAEIEKIQSFLHQKIVTQRLLDYGLTPEEASSRLSRLSDQEVRQVAMKIDQENPGGDALGAVVAVLVIGILVLLFIYLFKRV